MEQAAQDHMVRALVQAYKQQMQRMNAEIATFLRDAPGAFEAPPTQPKDS